MDSADRQQVSAIRGGTHATIDLGRYEANIRMLRATAGDERTFMAVLKANAYGHGAIECARAAVRAGAGYLAVARISEGIQIRRAGIDAPVLILGGPNLAQIESAVKHHLAVSVGTIEALDAVQRAAQTSSVKPVIHVKIDTGLHRYGALPDLAIEIASRCAVDDRIVLEGIYGHFSSADETSSDVTDEQIARSERLFQELASQGITFDYIHLPNSAATITRHLGRSNLVRSGIATFGLAPSPDITLPLGILPVMSMYSVVTRVFTLPSGEGTSYNLTYSAKRDESSATVSIGYADGLPRSLSNRGWLIVRGERCPIRGRVSMDQTVIGVPVNAEVGDIVNVIGDSADGAMSLDDLARFDDTINYEIATRVTARVPRVYVRDGELVGWDDAILGESSMAKE